MTALKKSPFIADNYSQKICPVCKKEFTVLWPHQWSYKRGRKLGQCTYYCSWTCLRALDKKGEKKVANRRLLTEEQEDKVVKMAIAGEDPRPFLAECGSKNPNTTWSAIRARVNENDPETAAKLPRVIGHKKRGKQDAVPGIPIDRIEAPAMPQKAETPEEPEVTLADAMKGMKDAADEFFGTCEEMGLTLEKAKKEAAPVKYDDMTVREVEGVFGRYRRSDVNGITYIDFECDDGLDVLSLTVNQWIQFREEQEKAFAILGVIL